MVMDKINPYQNLRLLCVGFRRWRVYNLAPLLDTVFAQTHFARNVAMAERQLRQQQFDCLAVWGRYARTDADAVQRLAKQHRLRLIHIEDGFVRSVGLGSDLIRPLSLVLDERGIYFDPAVPSDLEHILNHHIFDERDRLRAQAVRSFIVEHYLSKYNIDPVQNPAWAAQAIGKKVVFVPGQVENDASIVYGCTGVKTNLGLLEAARAAHPDDWIVYKPHPDVMARNRKGDMDLAVVRRYADVLDSETSVVSLIEACDVVHTMTSLTGFDALLRGKKVVVYGRPFYAGWGLTEDKGVDFAAERRLRHLTLDELVAGALLHYPMYYDWSSNELTHCETVLHTLVVQRDQLIRNGGLDKLRVGFMRRQWRKIQILFQAATAIHQNRD